MPSFAVSRGSRLTLRENDSSHPINQVPSGSSSLGHKDTLCGRAALQLKQSPAPTPLPPQPQLCCKDGQGETWICKLPLVTDPSNPTSGLSDYFRVKWEEYSFLFLFIFLILGKSEILLIQEHLRASPGHCVQFGSVIRSQLYSGLSS